jgi:hypothetical protein
MVIRYSCYHILSLSPKAFQMYLELFHTILTLSLFGFAIASVHAMIVNERRLQQKNKNDSSNNSVGGANAVKSTPSNTASDKDDDADSKIDVSQYRYPRVVLPSSSQLCPTTRNQDIRAPVETDYFIYVQNRTQLCLKASIAVSYEGTEFVVVGNSSAPHDPSKPELNASHCESGDFSVRLNQGTPITVGAAHDNIGLIKRLEADQDFTIKPGSHITVPAGCEVYFRNDLGHTKFLTKDSMVCTLLPPLQNPQNPPAAPPVVQAVKIDTKKK